MVGSQGCLVQAFHRTSTRVFPAFTTPLLRMGSDRGKGLLREPARSLEKQNKNKLKVLESNKSLSSYITKVNQILKLTALNCTCYIHKLYKVPVKRIKTRIASSVSICY